MKSLRRVVEVVQAFAEQRAVCQAKHELRDNESDSL